MQKAISIGDNETCGELFDRLSELGAECIVQALEIIKSGKATFIKQDESKASYTKIIKKEQAKIDWNMPAATIVNQIRAFNPSPVAFTVFNGEPFKIYSAEVSDIKGDAGVVLNSDGKLVVGAGKNSVSLLKVCKAGGKPMAISDFLRGNKVEVGTKLG